MAIPIKMNNGIRYKGILPTLLSDDDDVFNLHWSLLLLVQDIDDDDPGGAIGVFDGHDKQLLLLVLPEFGLYVLAGHGMHDDEDPLP